MTKKPATVRDIYGDDASVTFRLSACVDNDGTGTSGGHDMTFPIADMSLDMLFRIATHGIKQLANDKLAGKMLPKGFETAEDVATAKVAALVAGEWATRKSGGRTTDPLQAFLRSFAVDAAKSYIKQGRYLVDGAAVTRLSAEAVAVIRDRCLGNPAWVAKATTRYVPVEVDDLMDF